MDFLLLFFVWKTVAKKTTRPCFKWIEIREHMKILQNVQHVQHAIVSCGWMPASGIEAQKSTYKVQLWPKKQNKKNVWQGFLHFWVNELERFLQRLAKTHAYFAFIGFGWANFQGKREYKNRWQAFLETCFSKALANLQGSPMTVECDQPLQKRLLSAECKAWRKKTASFHGSKSRA